MALKTMQKVREAEENALKAEETARQQSQQKIESAKASARDSIQKAADAATVQAQRQIEQARKQAAQAVEKAEADSIAQGKALTEAALQKQEAVNKIVMEKII